MRTVVIAIHGSRYNDNLNTLPPSFYLEDIDTRVLIHNYPQVKMLGNKLVTNYDLVIDGMPDGLSSDIIPLLETTNYYKLRRQSKEIQHALLCNYSEKIPNTNFIVPKRFELDNSGYWLHGLPEGTKKILLKSSQGARGIGQVVLEKSDTGTMHALVGDYLKYLMGDSEEEFKCKHGTVVHLKGIEKTDGESIGHLKTNIGNIGLYEYVDNITTEWRVWTDLDCKPFIIGERSLDVREGEHKQATYIDKIVSLDSLPKQAERLLVDLGLEQMSVDVFRTVDGGWGIFEWQPQTGIASVSSKDVLDWHTKFIKDLILRKLPITNEV